MKRAISRQMVLRRPRIVLRIPRIRVKRAWESKGIHSMFITCACEHCDQNIEFATDDFQESRRTGSVVYGQSVECPGCGKETALFISQSPPMLRGPGKPMTKATKVALVILVAASLASAGAAVVIRKYGIEAILGTVGLTVTAMIYIAVGLGILLLAIFWILFPVLMYFQLKRSNVLLETVERNTRRGPATNEKTL
jgi:ribosomal protein S27E